MAVRRPSDPPSYLYISPGLLQTMRAEMRRFLLHSYTRERRLTLVDDGTGPDNPGTDSWNQPRYTFAPPEMGIPCYYEIREVPVITPQGLTTLNLPRLILAIDDTLTEGDHVRNIITADGTTILRGPVVVETLQAQDPNMGGPVLLEATLREVQFEPSS